MKRTIRKKFALYVVLVFFMGAPFTFAQSDNNTDFVGLDTSNSLKNIPKIIDFGYARYLTQSNKDFLKDGLNPFYQANENFNKVFSV